MKRFALFTDKETFEEALPPSLSVNREFLYKPNFNISAGESAPALHRAGQEKKDELKLDSMIWGWKEKEGKQNLSFVWDAQIDSESKDTGRCLIPANGFFIWKLGVEDPHPFYIRKINEALFFMAALYRDVEEENGHIRRNFCVIEEDANELISAVNPNMPLIIEKQDIPLWFKGDSLKSFLSEQDPLQLGSFITARVSERVNDHSANDPELIQPIPKLRDSDD
jgi:putative SOS response-associated peptidase YedK